MKKSTKKQKIVVIVGPTASGKTGLAIELAMKFNGEVISADSRQIYRGLDIGTAKATKKEMRGIPHHMLDIASPKRKFSASQFRTHARRVLSDLEKREKLPIICGGTGFYIDGEFVQDAAGEMQYPCFDTRILDDVAEGDDD